MPTPAAHRPGPARKRLLDAGIAQYVEMAPAGLFGGLSVSNLARRAGVTRATFYAYWPSVEAFLDDLGPFVLGPGRTRRPGRADQVVAELASTQAGLLEVMREQARADFITAVEHPSFRVKLGLCSRSDDPALGSALRDHYRSDDEAAVHHLDVLAQRWKRQPRPPLSFADLAVAMRAVLEGFGLRYLVEPDEDLPRRYADVLMALVLLLTDDIGHPVDLEVVLSSVDRFPQTGAAPEPIPAEPTPPGALTDPDPSAALPERAVARAAIDATRALLQHQPWSELGLDEIGAHADLAPGELPGVLGSKAGLATLVLSEIVTERYAFVPTGGHPVADLQAILTEIARVFEQHRSLTQSALNVFTRLSPGPRPECFGELPFERPAAIARSGQAAGLIRDDLSADDLAALCLRTIMVQQASESLDGRGGSLDTVQLLVRGALVDPATD